MKSILLITIFLISIQRKHKKHHKIQPPQPQLHDNQNNRKLIGTLSTEITISSDCVLTVTGALRSGKCECTVNQVDSNQNCNVSDFQSLQNITTEENESCERSCHQQVQSIINSKKRRRFRKKSKHRMRFRKRKH